jgi:DNA-binding transcriptional LysR family regulator
MDLDQIRAFLAVVRLGSISRASLELYRTQPAISLKIQSLEAELGHRLLERRRRGVTLTPAGEVLRRRAESILGELETLRTELADLSARRVGRVSLGASDTVCLYLLPRVLRQFIQKYPGIELRLFTQISRRVLDLIISDEIDLGIVTLPVAAEGIEARKIYQDRFVLVFPPGHPFERRRHLRLADLHDQPIIHLKPDTVTREWIDSLLKPAGLKGQVRMEVSTIEVIKRLVEVGLGVSLLPEMSVADEARTGRLRTARIRGTDLTRPMGLVHRRDKYFSLALTAFVEDLVLHVKEASAGSFP